MRTKYLELFCRPVKSFLVELALAWAGRAHNLELGGSGRWKLPKMRYKGDDVRSQRLRLQRNEPVSCLKQCMTVLPDKRFMLAVNSLELRQRYSTAAGCAQEESSAHVSFNLLGVLSGLKRTSSP